MQTENVTFLPTIPKDFSNEFADDCAPGVSDYSIHGFDEAHCLAPPESRMSQSFRVLEMLTSEEILNLLRYRLNDSQADVELEAQDYLASQHNGQDLRTESQFASFHD